MGMKMAQEMDKMGLIDEMMEVSTFLCGVAVFSFGTEELLKYFDGGYDFSKDFGDGDFGANSGYGT